MLRYALCVVFLFANSAYAQLKSQHIVTIDNPNFRKLVIAAPKFQAASDDKHMEGLIQQTEDEFPFLLQFSGLFKVINRSAYSDLKKDKKLDELQFWKMLSVDTVVHGNFVKSGKALKLEFSGLDVYRGRDFDKKSYAVSNTKDVNRALKNYVDYLLESYSGKPGIFNSRIVFAGRKSANSNREIFICEPDGSNVEQITKNGAVHISPSWHPSGSKIIFTSYESGRPTLYVYDVNTKSKLPVFAGVPKGFTNSGGKYSPDGKLIVYTRITEGSTTKDGSSDIYIVDPPQKGKSNSPREFIKGMGINVDPIFSPDGKWLVYVSGRYGSNLRGNPHLFRMELAWNDHATDVRVKGEKRLTFAGWWNAMPAWSPDSSKIAFAGFDKDINRFDLFIMNNDGTKMERLTLNAGDNKSPSFSPNGQMLVFHSSRVGTPSDRGRNQLYVMNADSTDQRAIYTGLYDAEDPKWGPYMKND